MRLRIACGVGALLAVSGGCSNLGRQVAPAAQLVRTIEAEPHGCSDRGDVAGSASAESTTLASALAVEMPAARTSATAETWRKSARIGGVIMCLHPVRRLGSAVYRTWPARR